MTPEEILRPEMLWICTGHSVDLESGHPGCVSVRGRERGERGGEGRERERGSRERERERGRGERDRGGRGRERDRGGREGEREG